MSKHETYKDDLQHWVDTWEKAQQADDFESKEKELSPSSQTAKVSYFGLVDSNPSDTVKDCDAEYWNHVSDMAGYGIGPKPDDIISENRSKSDLATSAQTVASSPNPVRHSTIGRDQGDENSDTPISPFSVGATYTPEDLEALSDLKLKLHDLEDKLNSYIGTGRGSKNFESQIIRLKKQINELSDSFGRGDEISPQGD